jgi:hypothetical protein
MRKMLFLFIVLTMNAAVAMPTVDTLDARLKQAIGRAADICPSIAHDIDQIKIMAGIGIAGSGVGAVAGGVALYHGYRKWQADDKISELGITLERLREIKESGDTAAALAILGELSEVREQMTAEQTASQRHGNFRTGASFVSGGAQAISATATTSGVDSLGGTIINMEVCSNAINQIQTIVNEMIMVNSREIALIERSQNIIRACRGMDADNIAAVRNRLRVAGIVSVIGTAAGITGGVTSAIAVTRESTGASAMTDTHNFNMAANVSAGVATGAGVGGAILSGTALHGLIKNGDIANACRSALLTQN